MARRAVLEGGKRDEIIAAATEIFLANGFEGTSVRMVLEKVGGEVGMFYHYFKSKDELFDTVVDRFFTGYSQKFGQMTRNSDSVESFVTNFLSLFEESMEQYRKLEGNMHWTIRHAMHERTVLSLIPVVEENLDRLGYAGKYPTDIAAGRIIVNMEVTIHSRSFLEMTKEEQQRLLVDMLHEDLLRNS